MINARFAMEGASIETSFTYLEQYSLTLISWPQQVSKAWSAVVVGGGCRGDRQDDPPSPHRFPGSRSISPLHLVCRAAPASHHLGSGPDQRGLSYSQAFCSGPRLRCRGDGERLGLLLRQVAVVWTAKGMRWPATGRISSVGQAVMLHSDPRLQQQWSINLCQC